MALPDLVDAYLTRASALTVGTLRGQMAAAAPTVLGGSSLVALGALTAAPGDYEDLPPEMQEILDAVLDDLYGQLDWALAVDEFYGDAFRNVAYIYSIYDMIDLIEREGEAAMREELEMIEGVEDELAASTEDFFEFTGQIGDRLDRISERFADRGDSVTARFDLVDAAVNEQVDQHIDSLKDWGNAPMRERVKDTLSVAVKNGLSVPNTTILLSEQVSFPHSARLIARTELNAAGNAARFANGVASMELGVTTYDAVWVATDDDRTRESHVNADRQRVGLGEDFTVEEPDGSVSFGKYPGDVTLQLKSRVNCRCALMLVDTGGNILDDLPSLEGFNPSDGPNFGADPAFITASVSKDSQPRCPKGPGGGQFTNPSGDGCPGGFTVQQLVVEVRRRLNANYGSLDRPELDQGVKDITTGQEQYDQLVGLTDRELVDQLRHEDFDGNGFVAQEFARFMAKSGTFAKTPPEWVGTHNLFPTELENRAKRAREQIEGEVRRMQTEWLEPDAYDQAQLDADVDEVVEETIQVVRDMYEAQADASNLAVRIPGDRLSEVLDFGLQNQHEAGYSNGAFNPALRLSVENTQFGVPQELPEGMTDAARPVYGYVADDTDGIPEQVEQYGDTVIWPKAASVVGSVTYTFGDSLAGNPIGIDPTRIDSYSDDEILASLGFNAPDFLVPAIATQRYPEIPDDERSEMDYMLTYMEAQIHGGVGSGDIAGVNGMANPWAEEEHRELAELYPGIYFEGIG